MMMLHFLNVFYFFQCACFCGEFPSFYHKLKKETFFSPLKKMMCSNLRQNTRPSQCRLDLSASGLHGAAGRQKLSEHAGSLLEMLEAKCFLASPEFVDSWRRAMGQHHCLFRSEDLGRSQLLAQKERSNFHPPSYLYHE